MKSVNIDSSLLDKAILFAVKCHANTERRGKGYPYIIHPLEAAEIVATITPDQELLAAAILHDTIEDTDATIEQIREQFGDRVANLVDDESEKREPNCDKVASWRSRKEASINHLKQATRDSKIVALGDKLSNMRAIAHDYEELGDRLWDRFHAPNGKADHEWHYRGLTEALAELSDTHAYKEFVNYVNQVFGKKGWAAALINMDDYEESGDGYTAISYNHKDGHTMVKLYNDFIPSGVPERELDCASKLIKMGIQTPFPGRFVTDGKRFGAEFQRISPKRSYARAISQEPDKLEHYALRFAEQCRKLHATPCDTTLFPSMIEQYRHAIARSKFFSQDEKDKMMTFVGQLPEATTCLHGDLHIGNIITNDMEDWWIDLSDFSYGHPLFDLGMTYFTAKCNENDLTMRLYHISNEQYSKFWDIFIRAYLGTNDETEIAIREAEIKKYAALRMVIISGFGEMYSSMLDFINKHLLS